MNMRLMRNLGCFIAALTAGLVAAAGARAETVTHYEYGDQDQPTAVWVEGDGTDRALALSDATYAYDTLGRRWQTRQRLHGNINSNGGDAITLSVYDRRGNAIKSIEKGPGNTTPDAIQTGDAVTENTYDRVGRLTLTKLTDGGQTILSQTEYIYDASGNATTTKVLKQTGVTLDTVTVYDALNRATKVTDPASHWQENTYDSQDRLIVQVSKNSAGTALAKQAWYYDNLGRLPRSALLASATGNPASVSPATDRVTDYTYDEDGRVLTQSTYNMDNGTSQLTTTNDYDDIGRLTQTTDPGGNWNETTYQAQTGRVSQRTVSDGLGQRIFTYAYDNSDRVTTETAEGAVDRLTGYEYDNLDRRTKLTDAENMVTTYGYDGMGRQNLVTEDVDGLARATDSVYDRLGRLAHLIAHDGGTDQITEYTYDLAGRRTKIEYPDSSGPTDAVSFEYDRAGRMTKKTDQRGVVTDYTYNGRGLLWTKTSGNDRIEFGYDGLGRMTLAQRGTTADTDAVSKSVPAYDDFSDLTSETQHIGPAGPFVVGYQYDQAGGRTQMSYPASVPQATVNLTYTYDALNRVDLVKRAVGTNPAAIELINYDYAGLYMTRRRITTTYKADTGVSCDVYLYFDPGYGEHRDINSNGNDAAAGSWKSGPMAQFTYGFDKVGNRISQAAGGRYKAPVSGLLPLLHDMSYGYDGLDRLTQATYTNLTGSPHEAFNYDLLGNRGGNSPGGPTGYTDTRTTPNTSILYTDNNPANEYALIQALPLTYDAAGNLTKDEGGFSMAYDADSQLRTVFVDLNANGTFDGAPTDTPVAEYKYDALGRRIEFKNYFDGGGIYSCFPTPCAVTVTTRYVHDGQNVIAEYNDVSARQRYYVHGTSYIDERAVMYDNLSGVDYYYLLKDLYTVVGLADKRGKELERYTYDAYGKATIVSIPTGDVNFDGKVNSTDRSVIVGTWGQNVCSAGPVNDINADGAINGTDRSIVIGQWTTPGQNGIMTIPASGLGNPYFFTGRTLDVFKDAIIGTPGAKQIYDYRTRSYEPEHGRFTQRDPVEYVDSLNLYEYVRARPALLTDPLGRQTAQSTSQGAGIWKGTFAAATQWYWASILDVEFHPSDDVKNSCCTRIGIIQIARSKLDLTAVNGSYDRWNWHLDVGNPWFAGGYANFWRATHPNIPLIHKDEPGWEVRDYSTWWSGKPSLLEQEFETCAVCAEGCYRGKKILSCFRWGHKWKYQVDIRDAKGKEVGAVYEVHRWASIGRARGRSGRIWIYDSPWGPGRDPLQPAYEINGPAHGPSRVFESLSRAEKPCSM